MTVESHRTNGDHVRDVGRQHTRLRPRMQAVVGNVEEVQFGGGAPTDARFRSVMLDVMGLLSERLAAWLPFLVKVGLGLDADRGGRGLQGQSRGAGIARPRGGRASSICCSAPGSRRANGSCR